MMKLWRIQKLKNCGREISVIIRFASDSAKPNKDEIIKEAMSRSDPIKIDWKESTQLSMIPVDKYEDLKSLSPAPEEDHVERNAVISKRTKNVMQQGTANAHNYELHFDTKQRWENPLMGWASTGDPLSNMTLSFSSPSDAVRYAEKEGWNWQFEESEEKKEEKPLKPKSYAENFNWKARTRVSTK